MKIEIRKSAVKDLKIINEPYKSKIYKKILELKNFPNIQNIKKLTNFEPAYRLRVAHKSPKYSCTAFVELSRYFASGALR